jgi:hypothetical protein
MLSLEDAQVAQQKHSCCAGKTVFYLPLTYSYSMEHSPISVGSVHLSESDLEELEELLRDIVRDPELEIRIKSSGFLVSEPSVDDLRSSRMCGKESLGYEIHLTSDEGELRLVADSTEADEHKFYIEGYSEWVAYAGEEVLNFMETRRTQWRSRIGQREVLLTEVASAILLSMYLTYFLPGRIIHYVPQFTDPFILSLLLLAFLISTKRNWVYPYVAVSLDGNTRYPQMKKIALPVVLTLISSLSFTLGFHV